MLPSASSKYNFFIEGVGFIGKVEDFKEPDINTQKAKTPDGIEQDLQILHPEGMKAEVSLLSVNKVIYDAIKKQNKAKFVIKEVVVEDGKNVNITHTITGNFNTENDTTKTKENKKKKIKINCIQYTKEQDGSEVIFADLENNILRINGEDIMEDIRNAIM